jgi:hypothetical protein
VFSGHILRDVVLGIPFDVVITGNNEDGVDRAAGFQTQLLLEPLIGEFILLGTAGERNVAGEKDAIRGAADLLSHPPHVSDDVAAQSQIRIVRLPDLSLLEMNVRKVEQQHLPTLDFRPRRRRKARSTGSSVCRKKKSALDDIQLGPSWLRPRPIL